MTEGESERGIGGVAVPPPPPWAAPAGAGPARAVSTEVGPEGAGPTQVGPEGAGPGQVVAPAASPPGGAAPPPPPPAPPPGPIGRSATEVISPVAPEPGPQTVTVSSGAPLGGAPAPSLGPARVGTGSHSRKPMLAVVAGLVVVLLVGIGLVVFQSGSETPSAAPVVGGGTPISVDTQPTTPPTTAPPTTQALPPATVVTRVTTNDPVVFITIDDGWHVPPEARAQLVSGTMPVTTFLLSQVLDKDPELWKELDSKSGSVENHSISHPNFSKMSLEQQKEQICTASQDMADKLGHFPTMFRPPYGATNANTAVAAGMCGIKYVVKWGASVNDGKVTFASGDALHRGDIVLMHYRPELAGDLAAVMKAAEFAGLKPVLLSDYLK